VSRSFFDRVERPLLAAWKGYLAAQQHDYELRMREVRRAWRRWIHQLRWQRQVARARWYQISCYVVFIVACVALIIVAVKTA
jgi:hypothetical protein